MSSPLPLRRTIDHKPHQQSAIKLDDENSSVVLESLASENSRKILIALAENPETASGVAQEINTSLQNVNYHLNNLLDAGLVTDVGTWYSSKGKKMTVYGVTSERLELQISKDNPTMPSTPSQPHASSSPTSRTISDDD